MNTPDFENITADQLKQFIADHDEKEYQIIDVRQPDEYRESHIPGAKPIPIMELVAKLFELPAEKDIIFYCNSGGRSMAASALALEEEVTQKKIYTLSGGILAWDGVKLAEYPRIRIFDSSATDLELLSTAMDLEKGALRFYEHVSQRFSDQKFAPVFAKLATAEKAHAKTLYGFWKQIAEEPQSFDELFGGMRGDIVEGGQTLEDMLRRIMSFTENTCINLMELALHIEYSAFDLYRTMAERTEDSKAGSAFYTLAQSEKKHMRTLIDAIGECDEI